MRDVSIVGIGSTPFGRHAGTPIEQLGVRVTIRHVVQGFDVAQLHPGDMGGSSVELDGLPERGRWFWDILDVDRPPTSKVDDIVAVDVATPDPDALCSRWAGVFGLDADGISTAVRRLLA